MRKVLLAFAATLTVGGWAQVFNVASLVPVALPPDVGSKVVAISGQGDFLLLTADDNSGLTKLDLSTGKAQNITRAAGAGYDARVSPDGKRVVYRENSFTSGHLRMVSLRSINLGSGQSRELVAPTRNLQGVGINNQAALPVTRGQVTAKGFEGKVSDKSGVVLSINNRQLMISRNGKTRNLSPNGKEKSYLWPSLSPDGTKILYYVGAEGAFVCNLDGSNVKPLGMMRAPQWWDDSTVVGMYDQDDGEFVYASRIVATNLKGDKQSLTPDSLIAMYPKVSAQAGKIAFSTPDGKAYIINVTKSK
jgi:hypothetical protein